MSITRYADDYSDELSLDIDEHGLAIGLDFHADGSTWCVLDYTKALPIADAIYEAAGTKPPAGAVLASSISFNEAILRVAAAHNRPVTFRYAKGKGGIIESRTLVPGTLKDLGDHKTFTGWDPDRDAVRAFRLDRIKGEVGL